MKNTVLVTKKHTNTKMGNAFMWMEPYTLFMKNIKKIKITDNLEVDTTGHQEGKIFLNRISSNLLTNDIKSYFIKFEKGSRSKIHLHDSDQIIIGMSGTGKLVIYSKINDTLKTPLEVGQSLELEEGEAVLIPAGKLHWHGAIDNQDSAQLSFMNNGKTFWF